MHRPGVGGGVSNWTLVVEITSADFTSTNYLLSIEEKIPTRATFSDSLLADEDVYMMEYV